MFTLGQLLHPSTVSSYLKKQNSNQFFFLCPGFFPRTCSFSVYSSLSSDNLRSSDNKGEKNSVSYGCSSHPEFYVSSKEIHKKSHKMIISDVRLQAVLK